MLLPQPTPIRLLAGFVLAVGLFVLSFLAIDQSFGTTDEAWLTRITQPVFPHALPAEKEWLFVNVKNYKQLITVTQEDTKEVITDRKLLTYFFRMLNERPNDYKILLCDVYFDLKVPKEDTTLRVYDDSLGIELKKAKKILVAGVPNATQTAFEKLIYDGLPLGAVDVPSTQLNKWQLMHGKLKTMPLLLYERLEQKSMGVWHFNHKPIVPYITNQQIGEKYEKLDLGDFEGFIKADKATRKKLFDDMLKDRIIVLGDFSKNDTKYVAGQEMYGSLILTNAYLTLKHQGTDVSLLWAGLLCAVFFVLCYRALYVEKLVLPQPLMPLYRFPLVRFLDYFWIGLALSLVSYAFWGIHLSVLLVLVYLKGIRYAVLGGKLLKLEKDLVIANQENEKLLYEIFPPNVAEELKATGRVTPHYYENVSIFFADVSGFSLTGKELVKNADKLAKENKTPESELIRLIGETFTKMDEFCKKYNVERIKTIGDCYMAVAGIPEENPAHALDITLACLEIQRWMENEASKENGNPWRVRLGIHTGKGVTGVIGVQRYAYDIWGDTVNIASRMEAKGDVGKINITIEVYELIQDFFEFEDRGLIALKHEDEGKHHAFFVKRLKPELSNDAEGFEPNEKFEELKRKKYGLTNKK